ncbi:MAG: bifunctional precorrin-2 dehydrogenase/sirohydrochlorin ferrochelatase [Anaerolineae bacterium]|nr:bifunctional precorrin-2 dehydrogenase/sirohydrochlorin ferrochelatase [Anaerolineae bacterium]MDW8100917.1 bifunctional precorrin-2 dehydrogenase/sirohydrochlorin ferrochelatase [Anaerolineae bacterium]
MAHYPIVLTGSIVAVVIGGGQVAERKVQGLLQAGAEVKVISPCLTPALARLAQDGRIQAELRNYLPGDLVDAHLAIAATNDAAVNAAVAEEAHWRGCLINVVDDPQLSNFHVPAVIRRGKVTIGISTAGASPALARYLRRLLESLIGPEYGQLAEIFAELRPQWRARERYENTPCPGWEQLIDTALSLLRTGQLQEARTLVLEFIRQAPQEG